MGFITTTKNIARLPQTEHADSSKLDSDVLVKELAAQINKEADEKFGKDSNHDAQKKAWAKSEFQDRLPKAIEPLLQSLGNKITENDKEIQKIKSDTEKELGKLNESKAEINNILAAPIDKLAPEMSKLPKAILSEAQELLGNLFSTKNKDNLAVASDKALVKLEPEEKENAIIDTKDILFSHSIAPNRYKSEKATVTLKSDGSLTVHKRDSVGNVADLSDKFIAIYVGNDNQLRDQNGNKIDRIQSGSGYLTASFVPNLFDKHASHGSILNVGESYLNNFHHAGKQIVFIKGSPEQNKEQSSMAQKEDKRAQKTTQKNTPWIKYAYVEQHNGQFIEKSAFVRVNTQTTKPALEIFMGRDYQGNEMWVNANSISHPKLTLVTLDPEKQEFLHGDGRKIQNFSSVTGSTCDSTSLLKSLKTEKMSGARAIELKKEFFNDLLVDGKRPVFFQL